jgi:P4 family phage/plasmid primase-like protien
VRVNEKVREFARLYVQAGFSVIPIRTDGSKGSPIPWKVFQRRRASQYEIGQLFRNDVGIAILGGKISGSLELIDFDRVDLVDPWIAAVAETAPGLIDRLPRIKTPKGGAHFYYRCSEISGNEKLAQESPFDADGNPRPNTLIETRGEGGYVLAPGSPPTCHSKNLPYEHVSGPPIASTPTITPEERRILLDAARAFNTWTPPVVDRPAGGAILDPDRIRPGDDYNARASWREILEPAGWTLVQQVGESDHWKRPGKADRGTSATTGHCGDCLYVFSSNAAPFSSGTAYTKFAAYAMINHGGDFHAAADALKAAGYGNHEKAAQEVSEFESAAAEEKTKPIEPAPTNGEVPTLGTPQKDYRKKKKKPKDRGSYFDGKEFLPAVVAKEMMDEYEMIASPISKEEGMGLTLFMYSDGYFKSNGSQVVRSDVDQILGDQSKTPRLQSVVDLLREKCKKDYRLLNKKATSLINVENGMLDWKTGKLIPHDSSYLSTIRINATWDENAESEILDNFLSDVFPSDALLLAEEILGYLMIPSTKFHKSFILIGEGSNGKSRFIDLIKGLAGEDNVTAISLHDIEDGRFAKANLFGKLVNVDSETADKLLKSTAQFKSITGEDLVMAEHKGKDPFFFTPFVRMVFSANRFPKSNDPTKGYFRRLIMIPFEREFTEENRDLDLAEKLMTPEARSRALLRAVGGLRRLMEAKKFTEPTSTKKALEDYRRECNSGYDFAKTFLSLHEGSYLKKSDVYEKYGKWCKWGNLKPFSEREFNKILFTVMKLQESRERTDGGFIRVWKDVQWNEAGLDELHQAEREVRSFGEAAFEQQKWNEF